MVAPLREVKTVRNDAVVLVDHDNTAAEILGNGLDFRIEIAVFLVPTPQIPRARQLGRKYAAPLLHLCLVGIQYALPKAVRCHEVCKQERQNPKEQKEDGEHVFEPQRRQFFHKRRTGRHLGFSFLRRSAQRRTYFFHCTQLPTKRKAAQGAATKSAFCSILLKNNGCRMPCERMKPCL